MRGHATPGRLAVAAAVLLSALAAARGKYEGVAACEARCTKDAGECVALCKRLVKSHLEVCTSHCGKEEKACTEECRQPAKR